jgi:hypothetical protein
MNVPIVAEQRGEPVGELCTVALGSPLMGRTRSLVGPIAAQAART